MQLRKPTTWVRTTLGTVASTIVGPEVGVDPMAVRRVHLFVRDSPLVQLAIDRDLTDDQLEVNAASYDGFWPEPPTNKVFCFHILAGQSIVGRAADGLHEMSVLIEYEA